MKRLFFFAFALFSYVNITFAAGKAVNMDWARIGFGSASNITAVSSCSDTLNNIYVVGYFSGNNVNLGYPTGSAIYSVASGTDDDFVVKYNSAGTFQWAMVLTAPVGAGWDENITSCVTDPSNNLYIGGYYVGPADLDLTGGTDTYTSVGRGEAFISKYTSAGAYLYTYVTVGSDVNRPQRVMDMYLSTNNLYVAGAYCSGDVDVDGTSGGTFLVDTTAHCDAYLSKYTLAGAFVGARTINGSDDENPLQVIADANDNVYISVNWMGTTDFNRDYGGDIRIETSSSDVAITKYNSSLNYQYTKTIMSTTSTEDLNELSIDSAGSIYVVGTSGASDLNIEGRGSNYSSAGGNDAFIIKYLSNGTYQFTNFLASTSSEEIQGLKFTGSNIIAFGRYFNGNLDFDFGAGEMTIPYNGETFFLVLDTSFNFQSVLSMSASGLKDVTVNNSGQFVLWGSGSASSADYDPFPETYTIANPNPFFTYVWLGRYSLIDISYINNTHLNPAIKVLDGTTKENVHGKPYRSSSVADVEIWKVNQDNILETSSSETFQETGALLFAGDDDYTQYDLPFSFPFYDAEYTSLNIGTNGVVCFDLAVLDCDWYGYQVNDEAMGPYISVLGMDIESDVAPGHGIFMDDQGTSVTIRWKANEYGEANEVNFALTLYPSGQMVFKYGPQTTDFYDNGIVGVAAGDGVNYTEASINGLPNYNNHASIGWEPIIPPDLLATTTVDMSADRDWSNVTGNSDRENGKVVVSNLANAPGANTTHSFYVTYKEGHNPVRVVICPGADVLSETALDCPNGFAKRAADSDTDIVTFGGRSYWVIYNVSTPSIGGISSSTSSLNLGATSTVINQGGTISITVSAKDALSEPDEEYRGTVHFSKNTGSVSLPGNYQFVAGDNGIHNFNNIRFYTPGNIVVSATDINDPLLTGNVSIRVNAIPGPSGTATPTPTPVVDCVLDGESELCPVELVDITVEPKNKEVRICFETTKAVKGHIKFDKNKPLAKEKKLNDQFLKRHCLDITDLEEGESYEYEIYVFTETDELPILLHDGLFILTSEIPRTGEQCSVNRPTSFKLTQGNVYSLSFTTASELNCSLAYGSDLKAMMTQARIETSQKSYSAYLDLSGLNLDEGILYNITCSDAKGESCGFSGSLKSEDVVKDKTKQEIEEEAKQVTGRILTGISIGLITFSAAPILFSVPRLYLYGILWMIPRKKQKTWGLIYDQVLKKPIAFAVARIFDKNGAMIKQTVSDLNGRYGFIIDPGTYRLEVEHSDYRKYVEEIDIVTEQKFAQDISLLRTQGQMQPKWEWRAWLGGLNLLLAMSGLFLSLIALIFSFNIFNLVIVILYLLQISVILMLNRKKSWGVLQDIYGNPITGGFVRVLDPKEGRQLDVCISDEKGRFEFILEKGDYLLIADHEGRGMKEAKGMELEQMPNGMNAVKINNKNIGNLIIKV